MSRRRAILITGAASGIGAALARRLAAPDVALLLHTRRNREGLGRVERDAVAAGAAVQTALGDLADPATAPALITAAGQAFGGPVGPAPRPAAGWSSPTPGAWPSCCRAAWCRACPAWRRSR